jgi:hypothetical protein
MASASWRASLAQRADSARLAQPAIAEPIAG